MLQDQPRDLNQFGKAFFQERVQMCPLAKRQRVSIDEEEEQEDLDIGRDSVASPAFWVVPHVEGRPRCLQSIRHPTGVVLARVGRSERKAHEGGGDHTMERKTWPLA